MEKGSRMISPEEIGHVVALSRQWADRPPDRILFERSDLDPQVRSQVALQVSLLDKMAKKIPHFLECGGYIPRRVNFEQCSSELAAEYKQRFLSPSDRILDMTGGLGIDTAAMASVIRHSEILEIEPAMAQALEYNLSVLLPPGVRLSPAGTPSPSSITLCSTASRLSTPIRHDGIWRTPVGG